MTHSPTPSAAVRAAGGHSARLPYQPGLDGLRALAVLAVLLYHAGLPVYGGFLGVESFFVLSGYLITALLLLDWQAHGRISLRSFWWRRARRLLPALFATLAGTLAVTALLLPEELGALGRDTLAALGYATNWYQIASGQSYFDAVARPSLLQHLWSLAIEEQFYAAWPLLCAAALRLAGRRGLLALTLALAAGSAALAAALFDPGADPSRIYYGTDTRAAGLLLGAALAIAVRRAPTATPRARALAIDALGVAALAGLLAAYALIHEQHPLLYRGGLAAVGLATALLIVSATHPAARLVPWLLELPPLRWVGLRSYGIYLWHWPIFMLTRPGVDLPYDGWAVQALRFGLAIGLAALSFALIERPVRAGALERIWRRLRTPGGPSPRRLSPLAAPALLIFACACIAGGVTQSAAQRAAQLPAPTRVASAPTEPPAAPASSGEQPAPAAAATPAATEAPAATDGPPSDAPPFDPELAAELQGLLDAAVADGAIPGAALAVRLADGTSWSGASGLADPETGTGMRADTRLRVGSLSKMFTAVVVLQLVEEGRLGLDDPVAAHLPDLLPGGEAIRVRDLLQHTSGLHDYLEDRRFAARAYQDPAREWRPAELVAYAAQFPPLFEAGEAGAWDYSNTNYVVLGMLVEQATGRTLAQELRARVIEPLELEATYVLPEERVAGPQARGYSKGTDQTEVAMSFTYGAASIVTTVGDLQTFGGALLSAELLEPETMALMEQFVDGKGQYDMPELEYGLGLMRSRLALGDGLPAEAGRVVGHIGGFGGFRAALWYAPASGTLVTLGMNQAAIDPNELAAQALDAVLRADQP